MSLADLREHQDHDSSPRSDFFHFHVVNGNPPPVWIPQKILRLALQLHRFLKNICANDWFNKFNYIVSKVIFLCVLKNILLRLY